MRSEDETESSRLLLHKWDETKKPGPRRKRRMHWKLIAVALVAVVVVVAVMVLKPREGKPDEEYVWVQYTASFKILETESNESIENVVIRFAYPHLIPDIPIEPFFENVNINFMQESPHEDIPEFTPEENLVSVYIPLGIDIPMPELTFLVSKLYVGDEVQVETWLRISKENLERLTLIEYFPENLATAFCCWSSPDETIGAAIKVQMKKEIDKKFSLLESWARETGGIPNSAVIRLFKE